MLMQNIFLDNQCHIYIFENTDSPDARHFNQLYEKKQINIVLSLENLLEFSQSDTLEQAIKLTQTVLTYSPKWIDSFPDIQKQEIRQFIYKEYLKKEIQKYTPHLNNFSDFFKGVAISPLDFVGRAFEPRERKDFENVYTKHANILSELQQHTKNKEVTKEIDDITLYSAIASRLSQQELNHLGFTLQDKRDLVRFCLTNRKNLFKQCPSLNTERHLSKYRSVNPKRKSKKSDSIDLTMSVAAYPYVDIFITNDGFLYDGLKYVSKNTPSIQTKIFRRINFVKINENYA